MRKLACTSALLAVASANGLTLNFVLQPDDWSRAEVYAVVTGDNQGLLNYDLSVSGITGVEGLASDAIDYEFARLDNISDPFLPTGFSVANNLEGPSGPDDWSAGASQFGATNPLVGLGKTDVFVQGHSAGVPDNPDIDVPFITDWYGGPLGSQLGVIDFGVPLDPHTLRRILGGGGAVFGSADAGVPIALDSPATIRVYPTPSPRLVS